MYALAVSHCKHHSLNKCLLTSVYVPVIVLEGYGHGDERHGWPQGATKLQCNREHSQENQLDLNSITLAYKECNGSERKGMWPDLGEWGRVLHTVSEGWEEWATLRWAELSVAVAYCEVAASAWTERQKMVSVQSSWSRIGWFPLSTTTDVYCNGLELL